MSPEEIAKFSAAVEHVIAQRQIKTEELESRPSPQVQMAARRGKMAKKRADRMRADVMADAEDRVRQAQAASERQRAANDPDAKPPKPKGNRATRRRDKAKANRGKR